MERALSNRICDSTVVGVCVGREWKRCMFCIIGKTSGVAWIHLNCEASAQTSLLGDRARKNTVKRNGLQW